MTGQAILRRAFEDVILMASHTCGLHVRAGQFEDGAIVIKVYSFPALDRMTRGTVRPQTSLMRIMCLVAGETVLFCPL